MKRVSMTVLLILVVGAAIALQLPVNQRSVVTHGVDRYENHWPLYGDRVARQELTLKNPLLGVGALLVNLRRADTLPPVTVEVVNADQTTTYARATIDVNRAADDVFAYTYFSEPVAATTDSVYLQFTAPAATFVNPVGIRFDTEDRYPAGVSFYQTKESSADLAVALVQKAPMWFAIKMTIIQNQTRSWVVGGAAISALLVTLLASVAGVRTGSGSRWIRVTLGIVLLLAIVAVGVRIWLIPTFHGVSGGDPYNYLSITRYLAEGQNPFAAGKRLPGLPVLLLPAYLTAIDDIWWMRFISSLAAGGVVISVALLARRLQLSWPIQLITAVALAWHKDFLWTSFRPEPYTLYTLLLMGALILFFSLTTVWRQILFGLVLGAAAMTRQEGFVAAALLGGFAIIFNRRLFPARPGRADAAGVTWWKFWPADWRAFARGMALTFGPALLVVLPFFVHNYQSYGHPFYTPYFEGERLQIVDSWAAFVDALIATTDIVGSMWWPSVEQLQHFDLNNPVMGWAFTLTIMWWLWSLLRPTSARAQQWEFLVVGSVAVAVIVVAFWLAFGYKNYFLLHLSEITLGILLASVVPWLYFTGWRGVVVLVVGLSQLLIATWFHPFAKHYQQVYPLLTLLVVTAVLAPAYWRNQPSIVGRAVAWRLQLATVVYLVIFPLSVSIGFFFMNWHQWVDRYNESSALDSVIYRAVQSARQQSGQVGFDQHYLQAHLYYRDAAVHYAGEEARNEEQEGEWLRQHRVETLVSTTNNPAFDPGEPTWELVAHYTSAGKDERIFESYVYKIPLASP